MIRSLLTCRSRRAVAEWLADIWDRLEVLPGARYAGCSIDGFTEDADSMLTGEPFINTDDCWNAYVWHRVTHAISI